MALATVSALKTEQLIAIGSNILVYLLRIHNQPEQRINGVLVCVPHSAARFNESQPKGSIKDKGANPGLSGGRELPKGHFEVRPKLTGRVDPGRV